MMDSNTRVRYERTPGFLDRIGRSLVGILIGLGLLVAASGLLFWNEGRAVQTAKSLDEGLASTVSLPSAQVVSMENDGRLVHLTGPLTTDKILSDSAYNIAVHAVKLRRIVEMYQWVEHRTESRYEEGGQTRVETRYSYSKEWRSDIVRSQSFDNAFDHKNPTSLSVEAKESVAENVHIGGFTLSQALVAKVNDYKQLYPDASYKQDDRIQLHNGMFYHSLDPAYPKVGDIRVKFEYAGLSQQSKLGTPEPVSIVARQLGSRLLAYRTLAGDELELLYHGRLSVKEIFGKEKMQNTMMTWGVRFGGWFLMLIGFTCLTSIVTTLVDWIPIVRDLITMGVFLMNVGLAISLSLTVIAIGWIRYRPLLGITILALGMTPFILSRLRTQRPGSRSRYD